MKGLSSASAAWHCAWSAPPASIRANQCSSCAGFVPMATNLQLGCFPAAVRSAASIRSDLLGSHCAGSSARIKHGASPWARRGSEPRTRTRAPVSLFSTRPLCAVSQTRQTGLEIRGPMKATTCSKAIRACSNVEATTRVSPRGTINGPSKVAHAIPDRRAVFPFPRPTDSAAVATPGLNASRINCFCQGSGSK